MIDHVTFAVADHARSRAFYIAALAPLGYVVALELTAEQTGGHPMTGLRRDGHPGFEFYGGAPASSPIHIAIRARTRAEVDAFHVAALAAGATDNGAPGPRPQYTPGYYAAFVIDPDGHNLEAVIDGAE